MSIDGIKLVYPKVYSVSNSDCNPIGITELLYLFFCVWSLTLQQSCYLLFVHVPCLIDLFLFALSHSSFLVFVFKLYLIV